MSISRVLLHLIAFFAGLCYCNSALSDDGVVDVEFVLGGLEGNVKAGIIVITVHPAWAPVGAQRFLNLVKLNHFKGCKFFRVIDNFMAQTGIAPLPDKNWDKKPIKDDPNVGQSNRRGYVTFATAGPNTRSQQIFFNFKDNSFLDSQGFTPFGEVTSGMKLIDSLHVTGEGAPSGPGPLQNKILKEGNQYLESKFPKLSYIDSCHIVGAELPSGSSNDLNQKEEGNGGDQKFVRGKSETASTVAPGMSTTSIWSVAAVTLFICMCLTPCKSFLKHNSTPRRNA